MLMPRSRPQKYAGINATVSAYSHSIVPGDFPATRSGVGSRYAAINQNQSRPDRS